MTRLYVICGHGNGDPGSSGGGKNEADLVRKLAARMKALGGGSVEVLDTSKNWYAQRLVNSALKKKVGRDPVVELHMDAANGSAKGGHVIIDADFSADGYDKALANYISKKFPGRADKLVKRNNLANLNRAQAQGINYRLLECCFIDNRGDREKFIADMDEVAAGILGAFGITAKGASMSGKWVQDSKGWWYRYSDGTWPKSKWLKLDAWYWFGADGYAAQSECLKIKGKWYAFGSDCRMKTSVKVASSGALEI